MNTTHPETIYLDLMETAVNAYGDDGILDYIRRTEADGVQEHGFPRLTANLGVLIANRRMMEHSVMLDRMMTLSCRDAARGVMPPKSGGNEFSVKELSLALVMLEQSKVFDKAVTDGWRAHLTAVDAKRCYSVLPPLGMPKSANWCVFGCASEQTRLALGLGGNADHVDMYVTDQLRWFDENGMYRDPNEPAVYDFVTRLQFALILHYGYHGAARPKLEEVMEKSAEPTLAMLSACGEIPYGGRSNQFLHNNTFYAALCEWYALRAAKANDKARCMRFRAAAMRAVEAMKPWLQAKPLRHVKNLFPRATGIGCENYAYFDKYMVTMGSWAMLGWLFLKDNPLADEPVPPLTQTTNYFATTPYFHLIMASAGDYSVEFDYHADTHYDSDGLGRVHRAGAPSALCMSCPCTAKPQYKVDPPNDGGLAIMPIADGELTPTGGLSFAIGETKWNNELTADGLRMTITGKGRQACTLPAFAFDGEKATDILLTPQKLTISYSGWSCIYTVENGTITDTGRIYTNRNGRYRRFEATAENTLVVSIAIQKA